MTASPAPPKLYTPDDLLTMEDGGHFELVDGELKERQVSTDSSTVAANFAFELTALNRTAGLGRIFDSELGIRIFPEDPNRTRRADISFLARDRVPPADTPFLFVAPDLVVEVVSPSDHMADVRAKVEEWLAAGVKLVWVALPESKEVFVYRRGARPAILTAGDELVGDDVVPGFSCPVARLFDL
jgi:Uma2 family endonuclease